MDALVLLFTAALALLVIAAIVRRRHGHVSRISLLPWYLGGWRETKVERPRDDRSDR